MKKYKLKNKKTGAITFSNDENFDRDKFEIVDEIKNSKSFHNKIKHS